MWKTKAAFLRIKEGTSHLWMRMTRLETEKAIGIENIEDIVGGGGVLRRMSAASIVKEGSSHS